MNKRNQRSKHKQNQKNLRHRKTQPEIPNSRGPPCCERSHLAGTRKVREVNMSEGLESGTVIEDIANLSKELRIPLRMHAKSKFKSMTTRVCARSKQYVTHYQTWRLKTS